MPAIPHKPKKALPVESNGVNGKRAVDGEASAKDLKKRRRTDDDVISPAVKKSKGENDDIVVIDDDAGTGAIEILDD